MSGKGKKSSSALTVADLVGALGKRAPYDLAEDWDNAGLLAGDASEKITGVIVAVNLGPEALAAAKGENANVIVCHHPPIFKAAMKFTRASHPYLFEAVKRGCSVIALHTNFDLASEALNRELAKKLSLNYLQPIAGRGGSTLPASLRQGKFITYVPETHINDVREAVCRAGAGVIGNYTQCSFSSLGEGTFLGGEGSSPTVGKKGKLEKAIERKLEVVFPWKRLENILESARKAHPYEEMAYDILELSQSAKRLGYGFIGEDHSTNLTFHKLLENVKHTFQLRMVTVSGPAMDDPKLRVKKVAFSPGSASSFVTAAAAKGADLYICGEVGYHQMLEARQKGMSLVVLGHSYSERFFVETASKWCADFAEGTAVKKVFEVIHDTL